MPAIQIDELGTQFYYHDSGVPAIVDTPYTTLVILHGFSFNSYIFHKLIPIAAASHVRLVLVNRRGYHGSTPLSDLDIGPLESFLATDAEGRDSSRPDRHRLELYTTYLQARAAELARFLVKFIENESIPLKIESVGRASGGLALMAWSLGNILPLSLLAFGNTLDPGMMRKLDAYMRKVVIYDPPHHVLGYPTPPEGYNPLFDEEIPQEQRQSRFAEWVSSYYAHSSTLLDTKVPVSSLLHGVLEQEKTHPAKSATLKRFTPTDISKGLETVTAAHGDPFVTLSPHCPVHRNVLLKALFGDYNAVNTVMVLPNTRVSYIWCTESVWETPYAVRSVQADMDSPPLHHYLQRSVKFFALEGANHYAHFDDPLMAMAMFARAIEY